MLFTIDVGFHKKTGKKIPSDDSLMTFDLRNSCVLFFLFFETSSAQFAISVISLQICTPTHACKHKPARKAVAVGNIEKKI